MFMKDLRKKDSTENSDRQFLLSLLHDLETACSRNKRGMKWRNTGRSGWQWTKPQTLVQDTLYCYCLMLLYDFFSVNDIHFDKYM